MIPSFFAVHMYETVESTNSVATAFAQQGSQEGLVVRAQRQTAGRGRHGRVWESPPGNMYASLLLRPPGPLQQAGHYSFVAAMAVYDAIAKVHHDEALSLKWPNDVLMDDRKISGILIETQASNADCIDWMVIGVGINVAHAPELETLYPPTCLHAHGCKASSDDVFEAFLSAFHHWMLTLQHDGFGPVRRAWLADAHRGPMAVRLPQVEINGNFAGLDDSGGLILRLADGSEKVIHAGDVVLM